MCTCAGECCFSCWGNNFIFQLLSKRILKRIAKALCKRKRFHNCQPPEIMANICIPNVPVNKHCLTHFIRLSQFLITIALAEDKRHCDYQQQTMPVNIFPGPRTTLPNSLKCLSLFAHDFASAPLFLSWTWIYPLWSKRQNKSSI